ncbi:MAG TPA: hypothetical protein VKV17_14140 [Bryobacteraceae bacterium]|nr:hypothetical protein [Bryobacteraceae bacterium]
MSNVPPPAGGLGSNSNYFLNNSGKNLNSVATTMDIATDIVASAGFGFQLNAYSPANETCAIQQYVIAVDTGGQMTCIVNNWQNASKALINNWVPLYKLPSAALPAGYECRIALQNDNAGNVTAATYTVRALSVPPAPGSALDGYETSFNSQQHVNYIGSDGHVRELVYTDHWSHTDLTAAAGAPNAAAGSALDGYQTDFNKQQHVNFIGTDGHVHELVYTDHWSHTDLTAAAGAPNAAAGSALDGYQTDFNKQQHVNFIGTDGHVHELVYTDHWSHTDLTVAAGAQNYPPAKGSRLDGYETSFNSQQHVNYIGTDGHVHELVYTNHWSHTDLSAAAGAPNAAAGSALDGYQTTFNNQQHVNFIGTDGHVHELVYTDHWSQNDLNNLLLASVTQTLTQISGVSAADLSPIVAFELDIVGYDNGQSTTLSSGSGTITYTAANAMTVANAEPSYCEFDGGTGETANTVYGELPTGSSTSFVQTFSKSAATIKAPKRNKLMKTQPARTAMAT